MASPQFKPIGDPISLRYHDNDMLLGTGGWREEDGSNSEKPAVRFRYTTQSGHKLDGRFAPTIPLAWAVEAVNAGIERGLISVTLGMK